MKTIAILYKKCLNNFLNERINENLFISEFLKNRRIFVNLTWIQLLSVSTKRKISSYFLTLAFSKDVNAPLASITYITPMLFHGIFDGCLSCDVAILVSH